MHGLYFNSKLDEAQRRERLYQGDLFVFSASPATEALCAFARELSEQAFAPHHPTVAQDHLPLDEYLAILRELKPRFIHHPRSKQLIQDVLAERGCDLRQTYFDVPRLRTMTHSGYLTSGMALAFPPHRDTWYSPPHCQLVWWLPVYEIEAENAMAFHPGYWDAPVPNTSGDFNYQHWEHSERKLAPRQVIEDTREISQPTEPLDPEAQFRVVTEPGGVTVFSGAQMHSTVPNSTLRTRFSIDFRTIHLQDVIAERGAPNVDDASTGSPLADYMRAADLARVPAEHVARHLAAKQAARNDLLTAV